MRLRSEFAFEAQSRTFNTGGDGGTFGQGIPALMDERERNGWALLGAANLPGDSGVRCNLGLLNTSNEDESVQIIVIDQWGGDIIGEIVRVNVGGYGWTQVNVFDLVGIGDQVVDNAVVLGLGHPSIRSYLSRIDNRSGDGTFILPVEAESVYSLPADWEVTATLTYSSSVTIDTLVYTGEDGEDQSVTAPPSGWTTTITFRSPAEFCYSATGASDDTSGQVTMEVLRTREGEATSRGRHTIGPGGEGPITIADCYDLH